MVGTLSDITERKALETRLGESELHFRTLANSGQALIWTSTPDKLCDYFNEPWLAFTGRSLEQELGNGWAESVHPEDFQRCLDIYVQAFDARESFSMEYRLRHHSGEYRWIVDQGTPRYDSKGEFLGYIGHCLDINEGKRTGEELERSRSLLEETSSIAQIGGWELNTRTMELLWSNETYRIHEVEPGQPVTLGQAMAFYVPEHEATIRDAVQRALKHGTAFDVELEIITAKSARRWVHVAGKVSAERGKVHGTFQDITARKRTERAMHSALRDLQVRQAEVEALQNASTLILSTQDFPLAARHVFDASCKLIGATAGFVTIMNADGGGDEILFLHPGDQPCAVVPALPQLMPHRGLHSEAYKQGVAVFENDFAASTWMQFMPTGHAHLENVLFAPLLIGGKAVGVMGLANKPGGFTKRDARLASSFGELAALALRNSRALQALENSEARFSSVAHTAVDAIITISTDGLITFFNDAAVRLFGYTVEETIGQPVTALMPEAFRQAHSEALQRYAATGQATSLGQAIERTGRRKDGTEFPLELSVSSWRTPEGLYFTGIIRDITERKQAEAALRQTSARLQATLETAMDGFWRVDMQGRLREVNEAYCRMSGYSAQELLAMSVPDMEAKEAKEEVAAHIRYFTTHGHDRFESLHRRKDGTLFDVEVSVTFQDTEGGGLVAFLRDITERKQAEAALLSAKDAAEAANRSKSEFLANMSHELRTPMNGVLGMLQLLMLEELRPSQQKYANNAFESANRLLSLLNDILDFSRIEAGVLTFKQEPYRPGDILEATVGVFAHICSRKGLELNIQPDPGLPANLMGDEARIRQIVFNLVGNAVKFTRHGAITVEAWHRSLPGDSPDRLFLSVSDTGVGIPEAKLGTVFDRFSQADASYTRQFEGAGLGLAIVRRIVDSLGGSLCIESEAGAGTCVILALPAPVAKAEALAAQAEASHATLEQSRPLRILLAEDELIGQMGARIMLERMGHSVVAVNDGRAAVEAALEHEFDCVLMDIQMPEMDGLEATRILRSTLLPGGEGHMPIIAMTAYALSGDREKFLAAGMDEYIAKPFQQDDLRALLQMVARKRRLGTLQ